MAVLDKLQSDTFNFIAGGAVDGDTIRFSVGDHLHWGIRDDPFGWGAGDVIIIEGHLTVDFSAGSTSSVTYVAAVQDVTVQQQDEASQVDVVIQIPSKILGDVDITQPTPTFIFGTGDTEVLSAQEVDVSQPTTLHVHDSNISAGTQDVPLTQPGSAVSVPVGDSVMWLYDGTDWLSLQTHILTTGFSNASPYTGDEFVLFGAVLTDANTGMRMRRASRWKSLAIQSDVGIGTPPSSSCSVQMFVNGVSQATLSWDGGGYGADAVITVDVGVDSYVTFKYVDDAGGQSAGKVVVVAEYRWRRT